MLKNGALMIFNLFAILAITCGSLLLFGGMVKSLFAVMTLVVENRLEDTVSPLLFLTFGSLFICIIFAETILKEEKKESA